MSWRGYLADRIDEICPLLDGELWPRMGCAKVLVPRRLGRKARKPSLFSLNWRRCIQECSLYRVRDGYGSLFLFPLAIDDAIMYLGSCRRDRQDAPYLIWHSLANTKGKEHQAQPCDNVKLLASRH